jgi:hypothetical protein
MEDAGYKNSGATMSVDGENAHFIKVDPFRVFNRSYYQIQYKNFFNLMPNFSKMHNTKGAGNASEENESQMCALAFQVKTCNVWCAFHGSANACLCFFVCVKSGSKYAIRASLTWFLFGVQGTMKIYPAPNSNGPVQEISGSGHHGIDYVGVASVRSGKGMRMGPVPDTSVVKIM